MTRIIAALALTLAAPAARALEVVVEPLDPRPGDVLRVEVRGLDNPARATCRFRGRSYPFFVSAPGRLRALIGLTASAEPGPAEVAVKVRPFLLPSRKYSVPVDVRGRAFSHQNIRMPRSKVALTRDPKAREAIERIVAALGRKTRAQRWEGAFLRPARGRRSSSYGHSRTINRRMTWSWHKGIDIAAAEGETVRAPNAGRVALAGRFPVQGGTVILDHGQGVMSAFLHLRSFDVEEGQRVGKGEKIAVVGGGGFSTGSHLHWGVYVHGAAVDPEPLLDRSF